MLLALWDQSVYKTKRLRAVSTNISHVRTRTIVLLLIQLVYATSRSCTIGTKVHHDELKRMTQFYHPELKHRANGTVGAVSFFLSFSFGSLQPTSNSWCAHPPCGLTKKYMTHLLFAAWQKAWAIPSLASKRVMHFILAAWWERGFLSLENVHGISYPRGLARKGLERSCSILEEGTCSISSLRLGEGIHEASTLLVSLE